MEGAAGRILRLGFAHVPFLRRCKPCQVLGVGVVGYGPLRSASRSPPGNCAYGAATAARASLVRPFHRSFNEHTRCMSDVDAALVERVLAGERHAYEALVARHVLWAEVLARLEVHPDYAGPAVQAAFVQAYQQLGRLPKPHQFSLLVRERLEAELRSLHAREPASALPPLAADFWMDAEAKRVAAARTLSFEQRALLALVADAQVSYEDLATCYGTTVDKIEQRLLVARRALSEALTHV